MEKIIAHLISEGWKEYQDQFRRYARCFYKRFDTPTRCACNDDKSGIQIVCYVYGRVSYELELFGELRDGTWTKVYQYGMPEDITQGLSLIPRMLSTWEHMANAETTFNRKDY